MISSMGAMPPLMSPESQSPPMWRVAQANMKDVASDPKSMIALAMLQQQLGKSAGQMMGAPGPMAGGSRQGMPQFDLYGNLQG